MARLVATAVVIALLACIVAAAAPAAEPADAGQATVAAVIDGDTVTLTDGRQLRLAGIAAPKRPLDRPQSAPWPLADAAQLALATLALGKPVRLAYSAAASDRYGRVLAQLHTADGTWVEGELLRSGMARVFTTVDSRAMAGDMLAAEAEARAAERGLWADPYYRIRSSEDAAAVLDSFQVVEGRIVRVTTTHGETYLDFGPDWRSDFTVAIDARARRLFATAGLAPDSLVGRRVRVRGWLKSRNGPQIDVTHPEQLELLAP